MKADRSLLGEVLVTWLVTVLLIRLVVELSPPDVLWGLPLALVPILFMWMPVWALRARGVDPDRYPLAIPAFDDLGAWRRAAGIAGALALAISVPYLPIYHLWQTLWFPELLDLGCEARIPGSCAEARRAAAFAPSWPFDDTLVALGWLLQLVGYHLFFVAIPEELFYRGYMQSRLDEVWPPRWKLFGAVVGPGWLVTCAIFAAGHSLVVFQWWHFAIFFPSLVFGWLRARTGGVMAGAFFHAWANVLVALLDRIYGVSVA